MSRLLAFAGHVASGIDSDAIRSAAAALSGEVAASYSCSKWKEMARKLAALAALTMTPGACMEHAYRRATSQQIFEN